MTFNDDNNKKKKKGENYQKIHSYSYIEKKQYFQKLNLGLS